MTDSPKIELRPVLPQELPVFKHKLQEAFAVAVVDAFGPLDHPIPSDRQLDETLQTPGEEVYHLIWEGQIVGGTVLNIDRSTWHNSLDLFFISVEWHSRGFGYAAWKAIETHYPETLVWHTITPYFEKRNIHFYINKCGFHAVEFWNKHHPEPGTEDGCDESDLPEDSNESFYFEKIMDKTHDKNVTV